MVKNQPIIDKAAFIAAFLFVLVSCGGPQSYEKMGGLTFGSIPYQITYKGDVPIGFQTKVDSVLQAINQSMSTYDSASVISQVNRTKQSAWVDPMFQEVFTESKRIWKMSDGAFDPTIGPLMSLWGFRKQATKKVDSHEVDSVKAFIGMNLVELKGDTLYKKHPLVQLDFGAIAKGYGVDEVAELFNRYAVEHYLIEIGGEVRAKGENGRSTSWMLKILQPDTVPSQESFALAKLSDGSMATSGNYRQYTRVGKQLRVHTMDPASGYSSVHKLLSATVFSSSCMTADAIATACMVRGVASAIALDEQHEAFQLFLIYQDMDGKLTFYQSPDCEDQVRISL